MRILDHVNNNVTLHDEGAGKSANRSVFQSNTDQSLEFNDTISKSDQNKTLVEADFVLLIRGGRPHVGYLNNTSSILFRLYFTPTIKTRQTIKSGRDYTERNNVMSFCIKTNCGLCKDVCTIIIVFINKFIS